MDLGPCSATVMAEQDCRAVQLSNNDLLNLCERDVEQFALVQMNIGRSLLPHARHR